MDKITLNNTIAMLEELVANGDRNPESLAAWFNCESELIEETLAELKAEEAENV